LVGIGGQGEQQDETSPHLRSDVAGGDPHIHVCVSAGTYPSRTIKLIVPYPPGAVTDAQSRPVAAELAKVLGQSVAVANEAIALPRNLSGFPLYRLEGAAKMNLARRARLQ
jgi:hypothetical protein